MYKITCDGFPLLDYRDNDLVINNPKVNLEVNTSGESSFTIYKTHPHYDRLKKLKSVFEVSDDNGVIFRGRMTGDTVDFNHGMMVDLEGALAYFNDSVVRPFNFPDDFLEDPDYITAAASGNVVSFFLAVLIDNHNDQVQGFQKMKLGTVSVTVPNNELSRTVEEYASTWEVLRAKLFDSSLGGYLCIRYEEDGNYIDYLSAFTETNGQEIVFGENLLDLKNETEASETYSAIIPVAAAGLTIEGMADGDITSDIVKTGDTLYSRSAVEAYGWIYAPTSETTWDEVVDDADLLQKGVNWLVGRSVFLQAMEATAVDLHFTDEQVESIRIYKNVNVKSVPHDVSENLPLEKLEIDLLNPQNTKITVGKTMQTLTEQNIAFQEESKKRFSKISKTDDEIMMEVRDKMEQLSSEINQRVDSITLSVSSNGGSTTFTLTVDGAEISTETLYLNVDAAHISGRLTAAQVDASELKVDAANVTGKLTATQIDATDLEVEAANVNGELKTNQIHLGGDLEVYRTRSGSTVYGYLGYVTGTDYDGNETRGVGLIAVDPDYGDEYGNLICTDAGVQMSTPSGEVTVTGNINLITDGNIWLTGTNIYSSTAIVDVSDSRKKNNIKYDAEKYLPIFDALKPASFFYNEHDCGKRHLGFIAQDVEEAMKSAGVDYADFAALDIQDGFKGLRYTEFIPILVAKIKELEREIKTLKESGDANA